MKHDKSKTWTRSQVQTEGSLWEICVFAVFFIVIFSAVARAEAAEAVTPEAAPAVSAPAIESSTTILQKGPGTWKPAAKLLIETTRTLQEDEQPSYGGAYQLTVSTANKELGWSANAKIGYTREYSYERDDGTDGSMDNPSAGISKKFTNENWGYVDAISWGLSGSLPGSREMERRTFQGSLGTSVRFAKSIRKLDLAQAFSYTRGFYEYDIRADGTVNSPDQFKSTTELAYNVTEKLGLSLSIGLTQAVNFQGTAKGAESSAISVDYAISERIATSLGVSTDRGTMLPDGESNRVRVFDPEVAQAFFDIVIGI